MSSGRAEGVAPATTGYATRNNEERNVMSYTKGRWRANRWATSYGALPQTIKIYSGKLLVAETPYYKNCKHHNFVNARRIAACVNACEGIPTEELEARIKGHNA